MVCNSKPATHSDVPKTTARVQSRSRRTICQSMRSINKTKMVFRTLIDDRNLSPAWYTVQIRLIAVLQSTSLTVGRLRQFSTLSPVPGSREMFLATFHLALSDLAPPRQHQVAAITVLEVQPD